MLKRIKNTLIYWLIRVGIGGIRLLPYLWACRFCAALGRLAFVVIRGDRRRAIAQLQQRLGLSRSEATRTARRLFIHLGQSAGEAICAHKILHRIDEFVEIDPASEQLARQCLEQGQPLVFVTGHFGNWELMAIALGNLKLKINTIARASYDPRLTELIENHRHFYNVGTILRGDPQIKQKMAGVMQRGEFLALFIDQDTKVKSAFVPFFGREAFTPTGAAFIADRFKATVAVGGIVRTGRFTHRLSFSPLELDLSDHVDATARMTRELEAIIRKHPEQWVWMHNRWKTRPGSPRADALLVGGKLPQTST